MDAVRTRREGDVKPVVDQQGDTGTFERVQKLPGERQEFASGRLFVSQLHGAHSAVHRGIHGSEHPALTNWLRTDHQVHREVKGHGSTRVRAKGCGVKVVESVEQGDREAARALAPADRDLCGHGQDRCRGTRCDQW